MASHDSIIDFLENDDFICEVLDIDDFEFAEGIEEAIKYQQSQIQIQTRMGNLIKQVIQHWNSALFMTF